MTDATDTTRQTLAALGVSTAAEVAPHFAAVRAGIRARRRHHRRRSPAWKSLRDAWIGRKSGVLTRITDNWLKPSPPELKRVVGQELNQLRAHVEQRLDAHAANPRGGGPIAGPCARPRRSLAARRAAPLGSPHLLRQTFAEIERIFLSLGFRVVEGPEIETPYYNFEALNIPEHHPARDTMDTFYLAMPPGAESSTVCLRTHTSPRAEVHTMESQQPPVRIIVPGKDLSPR